MAERVFTSKPNSQSERVADAPILSLDGSHHFFQWTRVQLEALHTRVLRARAQDLRDALGWTEAQAPLPGRSALLVDWILTNQMVWFTRSGLELDKSLVEPRVIAQIDGLLAKHGVPGVSISAFADGRQQNIALGRATRDELMTPAHLLQACMFHAHCICVARTLQACCTHAAHMLHACCMHVACMLHTCCMDVACMLHACCTHVGHVTRMLHAACTHAACMLQA